MNGEVIKSFLVGLGFGVDDSSLAKFNKAISSATVRVTALYASVQVAAAGIFKGIQSISEGFEQIGYEYRIISPALNKALLLRNELLLAYRKAGINLVKVVQQSVLFNFSLQKTKFALEAIYKSVGARFFPLLTKQMDIFRSKIYANMPKIQSALETFIKLVFRAFEATSLFGARLWGILGRVYDFFVALDRATDGWSTKILAFATAWKLLNLSFIATPLGAIITGIIALIALWDDFKVWKEGGKSLFSWTKEAAAAMELFEATLGGIATLIVQIAGGIKDIINADFNGLLGRLEKMAFVFKSISDAVDNLIRILGGSAINKILNVRDSIDKGFFSLFSGNANPFFNPDNFATPPINAGVAGGNNQSIKQQTNINVQGAADANATAGAIAGQQKNVNQNLIRNLKAGAQ